MIKLNTPKFIILMVGFLSLFALPLVSAAWTSNLDVNLGAYWSMNETSGNLSEDLYSSNYNATRNSNMTSNSSGIIGYGTQLIDGGNGYFITNLTSGTSDFTWSLWLRPNEPKGGSPYGGTAIGCNENIKGAMIGSAFSVQNKFAVWVADGTGNAVDEMMSPFAYDPGTWYHVVVTRSGTNVTLWVNASAVNSSSLPANYNVGGADGYQIFGMRTADAGYAFNGNMDEVGYWTRALNSSEISQLYNSGNALQFVKSTKPFVYIETYNSSTYETKQETIRLDVQNSTNTDTVTATLTYNGVVYNITNSGNNTNATFIKTFIVPLGAATRSFNWNVSFNSTQYSLTGHTQVVDPLYFALCNSTITNPYINFTFKDEETNAVTNGSLTASFVYYLGDGSITKSSSYQNTTDQFSYAFCTNANTSTLYVTPSLQFSNYESVLRTYNYQSPLTLTNSVTNKILSLLKTSNGIYSSYQVVTSSLGLISNASVTFSIGGNLVESKLTDGSGIATFFLNPNTAYTLVASKSGYTSYSTTIYPTQSTYTISLSILGSGNITSYNDGINYTISPGDTYLINDTTYNFNASLFSSYLNVDSWGFNITNGTTNVSSTTGTGGVGDLGNININFNTGNYTTLNLILYWTINGTTTSVSKVYIVQNLEGTGWGISNFATDLRSYLVSGFFGLTSTGLNIIIFVLIMITVGVFSYKFGLTNPAAIAIFTFVLVFIFDYGLGLIYIPINLFSKTIISTHIATWLIGVIALALGIKEASSY